MPDDDLFPETTFGGRCAELLKAEKVRAGNLSWEIVSQIIEDELARSFPREKRVTRALRDELFNTLCRACGQEPAQLTRDAAKLVASSMAQIKDVSREVTAPEIRKRVERYKRLYPGAGTTPRAIAMHWAALGTSDTSATKNLSVEPHEWRERLRTIGQSLNWDTDRIAEICAGLWRDVPLSAREILLKA